MITGARVWLLELSCLNAFERGIGYGVGIDQALHTPLEKQIPVNKHSYESIDWTTIILSDCTCRMAIRCEAIDTLARRRQMSLHDITLVPRLYVAPLSTIYNFPFQQHIPRTLSKRNTSEIHHHVFVWQLRAALPREPIARHPGPRVSANAYIAKSAFHCNAEH